MKIITKYKKISEDIKQMKNINQLIEYISMNKIEKFLSVLLIIWVLSPIYIIVLNICTQKNNTIDMLIILMQIGIIGCILQIILFVNSIMKTKCEKFSLKQFLSINSFPLFLFLMLVWSIFSCFFSKNFELSFFGDHYRKDGLLTYFAYCGVFCCGYNIRNNQLFIKILHVFTLSASLLSILILVNSTTLNKIAFLTINSSVFDNINHFGYYICLAIMCGLLLFLVEKKSIKMILYRISLFAIMVAALVKNGSLGPYLAVIIGLVFVVIFMLFFQKGKSKRILTAIAVFFVITVFLNFLDHHIYKDISTFGGDIVKIATNSKDINNTGSGRWSLLINGIRFITERPLFGYGPDNLRASYAEVGILIDRPHNEIIQFAASLGIPAALFYIFALFVHFLTYLRNMRRLSIINIGIFCTLVAYLASSMFGNTMYYTTPFFFMILGLSRDMIKLNLCRDEGTGVLTLGITNNF